MPYEPAFFKPFSSDHTLLGCYPNYFNQIYYVNNEPESPSSLRTIADCNDCWDPLDRNIDIPGVFNISDPNAPNAFWQNQTTGAANCESTPRSNWQRIQAKAMAYVYLRLRVETSANGHLVLPPSSNSADFNIPGDSFWSDFFYYVHSGVTINGSSMAAIHPATMKVLHMHVYSPFPDAGDPTKETPLANVASTINKIQTGVNWYRNLPSVVSHLGSGAALPLDLLISEMGPDWQWKGSNARAAAGYFSSFRDGLSWWSTLLLWYTRRAHRDCNLEGASSGRHIVHSGIHEASEFPFVIKDGTSTWGTATTKQQWFFNSDAWATYIDYGMTAYQFNGESNTPTNPGINDMVGAQQYRNYFTSSNSISWGSPTQHTWRRTPLGACYTVWARRAADPVSTDLNLGWVANTSAGLAARKFVTLPPGYSTVYFPVYKDVGAFITITLAQQITFNWVRKDQYGNGDGAVCTRGYMNLKDFPDTTTYTFNGVSYPLYSAMTIPVVCWNGSSADRQVTVELNRPYGGPQVWLGRPWVLPGACSWLNTQ